MSAAYGRLTLARAAVLVSTDDHSVPEPPPSGIKSITVPRAAQASSASLVAHERTFRGLYESHSAFVWRNLRRLGVADADVEDKMQEVFVVAHRRWSEFEDRGHGPRAWLFQIVLRVAADTRRHRRRHPVDPDGGVAQERESIEPAQVAAMDRREKLQLLDRALETIEIGRRAVLVLHEIEQMSAPEIARTLDLPVNTVYSRLRVARTELERAVRELRSLRGDE